MPTNNNLENLIKEQKLITGKRAIELSGMQDALSYEIAAQNQCFGTMTTFRVSNVSNLPPYNMPGAPKPSSVYSKTSFFGCIPVESRLTKLDAKRVPLGHHHKDEKKLALKEQPSVQLKLTLYEILKCCDDNGNFKATIDKKDPNVLVLKFKKFIFKPNKGPKGFKVEFRVHLDDQNKEDVTRVFTRSGDVPETSRKLIDKFLKILPKSIRGQFADEKALVNKAYPIFYKIDDELVFYKKDHEHHPTPKERPYMVFSKEGKPIIGDWDKDSESMPLSGDLGKIIAANKDANTPFNTFDAKHAAAEQHALLEATNKLFKELCSAKEIKKEGVIKEFFSPDRKFLEMVDFNLLERAGVITPYELLRNMLANYWHNKDNMGYFENPFQHGAENRSPIIDPKIKPDAGGPRLHIYQGQFIYTENEDQRVKLFLIDGFLENNFIHIHPLANMEKWHQVIAKQISLGQQHLILPETIKSYNKYCQDNERLDPQQKGLFRRRSAFVGQENPAFNGNNRNRSLSTIRVSVRNRDSLFDSTSVGPSTPSSRLTSSSISSRSAASSSLKTDTEMPGQMPSHEIFIEYQEELKRKRDTASREAQREVSAEVRNSKLPTNHQNPLEVRPDSRVISDANGGSMLLFRKPLTSEPRPSKEKPRKKSSN